MKVFCLSTDGRHGYQSLSASLGKFDGRGQQNSIPTRFCPEFVVLRTQPRNGGDGRSHVRDRRGRPFASSTSGPMPESGSRRGVRTLVRVIGNRVPTVCRTIIQARKIYNRV